MSTSPIPHPPEEVSATFENGVWHIRIQRPAKRNALTMTMFSALAESLHLAQGNPAVRSILLTGEGKSFCSGHDLQAFDAWPQSRRDPVPQFLHALASLSKPLVVAVQGGVAGIGVTLLLHADWVVSTPGAKLKMPFAELHLGPEAASSLLLIQAVGAMRAKRLLLGGEAFSGQQAYHWGLVSELEEEAQLFSTAARRASDLIHQGDLIERVKRWGIPEKLIHERIDEEIQFINERLARRATDKPTAIQERKP